MVAGDGSGSALIAKGWDLQLLVGPVGREGSQQAVAVAVDPEHGGA
jgi:hypothetical protein